MQARAVQTPAGVPLAPLMLRSTKLPAATGTPPETVQDAPGAVEQESVVVAMLPGETPVRRVTAMVFVCCEKTVSVVAVHPDGTHVSAGERTLPVWPPKRTPPPYVQ